MPKKKNRWEMCRKILKIGLPLAVSMSTTTVMEFTDRVFLGWYSLDALAAATPAAMFSLLCVTVFFGTGGYVSVFVAQYVGSSQPQKVGSVLWQGIYLSGVAAIFTFCVTFWLPDFFAFVGHSLEVQRLEVDYCTILCFGGGIQVLGVVLSAFFSGQGKTRMVMIANMAGMSANIPLNYTLINGVGPFPELGITGAGLATVAGSAIVVTLLASQAFTKKNENFYCVRSSFAFCKKLFGRLLYYGFPGGIIFFLEMFSFTAFIFAAGKVGTLELAASNIALTINSIAFLPLVGFSMATSILTGQAMGGKKIDTIPLLLRCSLGLVTAYLSFMSLLFLFYPELFLSLFHIDNSFGDGFQKVGKMTVVMLRFVVCYLLFDGITYAMYGVLKGAGDTWFVMVSQAFSAVFAMFFPLCLGIYFELGVYFLWGCVCFYIISLALMAVYRYRQGKWRFLHVIES